MPPSCILGRVVEVIDIVRSLPNYVIVLYLVHDQATFFGHKQMCLTGTSIIRINTGVQFHRAQQPVRFRHGTFARDPFRLDGIGLRAFHGEQTCHNPHLLAARLHALMTGPCPRADPLACGPQRVIPDQQQGDDPVPCQTLTAPGEKLCGHGDVPPQTGPG